MCGGNEVDFLCLYEKGKQCGTTLMCIFPTNNLHNNVSSG
ncbi:hypothetical protein HMPREF6745_0067 [Prevotella sp. oral taxon 472 str. F0295]|nr:hypothetical protein HMPREF6745_0067 [Prevotella sp. oral taxon 472 str. F0295]